MITPFNQAKETIKLRAIWAKDFGYGIGNLGIVEDANKVLDMLKAKPFDMQKITSSEAYQTVLRSWYK